MESGKTYLKVATLSVARISLVGCRHLPPTHHVVASIENPAALQEILGGHKKIAWSLEDQETALYLPGRERHSMEGEGELSNVDPPLHGFDNSIRETNDGFSAGRGHIQIVDDILLAYINLEKMQTKQEETIMHLCIRNKQYNSVKYLLENLKMGELAHLSNHNGNIIYHIAPLEILPKMANYLFRENQMDIPERCQSTISKPLNKRETKSTGTTHGFSSLGEASCNDNIREEEVGTVEELNLNVLQGLLRQLLLESEKDHKNHSCFTFNSQPLWERNERNTITGCQHNQSHQSCQQTHDVDDLCKAFRTLAMLALLLVTVTLISFLRPPRASLIASLSSSIARKTFKTSNVVAFFLSLCSLTVSVSVLKSKRSPTHKRLAVNQVLILLTSMSMVVGFVSGTWMGVPHTARKRLLGLAMVCIQVGGVGLVTIGPIAMAMNNGWLVYDHIRS